MKNFSDRLREARKLAGHTQETISLEIGMIRTNYSPYETGKKLPDITVIPKLAKALKISPLTLFSWIITSSPDEQGHMISQILKGLSIKEQVKILSDISPDALKMAIKMNDRVSTLLEKQDLEEGVQPK